MGVGDLWGNIPPPSPPVCNPNHVIIIIVILFIFSQVVNAEQQIVRKRVKKEYIVPRDSQWTKQWSLVSLDLIISTCLYLVFHYHKFRKTLVRLMVHQD